MGFGTMWLVRYILENAPSLFLSHLSIVSVVQSYNPLGDVFLSMGIGNGGAWSKCCRLVDSSRNWIRP